MKTLETKEMDRISWKILKELCENPRITNAEIGRRVGLSAPAVADRIQKMEEHGIIKGYTTKIDLDKVGLTIRVHITFKATSIGHRDMIEFFNTTPEIIGWHAITGNVCAMLKAAVATSSELEDILERLGQYGETNTTMILSGNVKLPIPDSVFSNKI